VSTPNSNVKWIVGALVLLVALAAGAYLWLHQRASAPLASAPAAQAPANVATAPPPVQHPITQAVVTAAPAHSAPLPALADSDGLVHQTLSEIGAAGAGKLLAGHALIAHMVGTINALTGRHLPENLLPVRAPAGSFRVERTADGELVMAPDNITRYAHYARVFDKLDTQALVDAYVHAYPLFQQAWRQLGYPRTQFNDRLVTVLDLLLKTPVPAKPPKLEGAGGLYRFVDPRLENLAIGQKILIRLGPKQETAVLAKLRAIRAALTGKHPAAPATTTTH